jgi:uncharacterized protein YlxW (UPF0749 family)
MKKSQIEFPVSIYGNVEKYNDIFSKARCRVFYKGANRNGTYITDEFADELISTFQYIPVKGIYDGEDFTDHGTSRSEGQIYGIVPETNNFAWEQHLDKDGVERTYACTDVLLFTALYPEANDIISKPQSMELYEPSLSYHMAIVQGQKYVVFDHGRFLGLQVLGDTVEPCFEGASFFTLQKSIEDTIQKIKDYSNIGGNSEMEINFKLSDSQKYNAIWTLLNPEYNEEGGWTCSYAVNEVYDDYALAYNFEEGCYERVYYTKDDATDSLTIDNKVKVFIVDVTAEEKNTLDTLRVLNGDTYELVNENLTNAEKNATDCAEFSTKIEELNSTIATLNTEVESAEAKIADVQAEYDKADSLNKSLAEELESLKTFKKNIENQSKEAVISEYSDKLSETVLDTYRAKLDDYTAEELDMHLTYELKKTGASVFTQTSTGCIPKDDAPMSGVEAILSSYKIK